MKEAPPLTPNAQKVVSYFKIALLVSLLASLVGLFHLMESAGFHPQDHWSWWPVWVVSSLIATKILYNLLIFIIVMLVYKGDFKKMEEESYQMDFIDEEEQQQPEVRMDEITLTIVTTSEKPVGHYLDAPIYEWIEFTNEAGQKIIGEFVDTVDMTKQYSLPEDCMVVDPGIVFKLKLIEE